MRSVGKKQDIRKWPWPAIMNLTLTPNRCFLSAGHTVIVTVTVTVFLTLATMPSMVKITSGKKRIKQKIVRVCTRNKWKNLRQKNKKVRSEYAYVSRCLSHAKRVSTERKQERRQHARGMRLLQARKEHAGGGVAPRRSNRITAESATRESREAKRKAKKAVQETETEKTKF